MNEPKLLPTWSTMPEAPQTQQMPINQAPFLTNNWRMVQANGDSYKFDQKYIKVRQTVLDEVVQNVATITNSGVLLRCVVPLSEGYYTIDTRNEFIKIDPTLNADHYNQHFEASRDVEMLRPDFQKLECTPPFPREEVARFIEFLSFVRQESRHHLIVICQEAAYMVHKQDQWYKFPCALPVKGDGLVFDAYNLKLAFTEMLRYDCIIIGRDNRGGNSSWLPLVIGRGWGNCALIMNRSNW